MKFRSDYVSNSSSSSFVLKGDEASLSLKMFLDDFSEFINDYEPMGETMRVCLRLVSRKNDWDYIDISEFIEKLNSETIAYEDVDSVDFSCDDYDSSSITMLNLLWKYFKKRGFNPDDSDSEKPFNKESCGNRTMIEKLFCIFGEDNKKKEEEKE